MNGKIQRPRPTPASLSPGSGQENRNTLKAPTVKTNTYAPRRVGVNTARFAQSVSPSTSDHTARAVMARGYRTETIGIDGEARTAEEVSHGSTEAITASASPDVTAVDGDKNNNAASRVRSISAENGDPSSTALKNAAPASISTVSGGDTAASVSASMNTVYAVRAAANAAEDIKADNNGSNTINRADDNGDRAENNAAENEARRSSDAGSDDESAAGTGGSVDSGDGAAEDGYTGRLRVQVFTASGAYPVSNALVTVSNPARGLINAAITNSGGQTDMFVLPAPAPSESFRPGEGIPYELYSIDTSAPGFYGVKNLGVAVYPEITTIQRVELIPVSAIGGGEVIIYEPNAEL